MARGSKTKKVKINAYLTKDPVTGKITAEVATYKQKKKSRDIDDEGFKVTSIELGTINKNISNNFFKFSTAQMLTQSEKYSKENKKLMGMIVTMATYIHYLINIGAAPIIYIP